MRRAREAISTLTCVAVLTGCAVGPDYRTPKPDDITPVSYPATTAIASSEAPTDRWWVAFNDPLLNDLITRALSNNPDLASAEARVQQARAMARVAGAAFYPSVDAVAGISRDKLSENSEMLSLMPVKPTTTQFTDYKVGFDAAWEIDLAGRTRREVEAAVARLGSTEESRNDARLVVAAEVASRYVDYRVATTRLEIARARVASFEETRRLTVLANQAGEASESDVAAAEAARLDAAGAVPTLAADVQSAVFALSALTGESLDTLTTQLGTVQVVPVAPTTAPIGLPSTLLQRRPDVRYAERELAAATADVGAAVAQQFPRLSLVGDFGWNSVNSGSLTDAASRYWSFGPQLTVPLFAGGRLRAQSDAARAANDAALATYRATVLRAFADTESAIVRFAGELDRQAQLAQAANSRQSVVAYERRRYEAGDASNLDVLAAQRQADQAADQRTVSSGQLARNYIALGKALGGGWQ